MDKISAILSDFDGTLYPTSGSKHDSIQSTFNPLSLEKISYKISGRIPICILTSKDFDFVYPRTKKFAWILSCILGVETFIVDKKENKKNIIAVILKVVIYYKTKKMLL